MDGSRRANPVTRNVTHCCTHLSPGGLAYSVLPRHRIPPRLVESAGSPRPTLSSACHGRRLLLRTRCTGVSARNVVLRVHVSGSLTTLSALMTTGDVGTSRTPTDSLLLSTTISCTGRVAYVLCVEKMSRARIDGLEHSFVWQLIIAIRLASYAVFSVRSVTELSDCFLTT